MRRILATVLGLALASAATGALAQTYQQYGDDREGGYSYSAGDPNAPGGYVEEQEYHRADYGPAQTYDYGSNYCSTCGGPVGGYEVPTYGYASQNYGWPGAMCGCGGELSYGYMGSGGYGGVGGPASYGYGGGYGGGYMYSSGGYSGGYGRGWSSSSASARAYSSSSTTVRVGGGHHGGGKGH